MLVIDVALLYGILSGWQVMIVHILVILLFLVVQISSFSHQILRRKVSILPPRSQPQKIDSFEVGQNANYSSKRLLYELKKVVFNPNTAGVLLGTINTVLIIKSTPFQTVASPIIGILSTLLFPTMAPSAYCGSFIGSIVPKASDLKESLPSLFIISMVAALQLTIFDRYRILSGVGGRLGFIAFASGIMYQLPHYLNLLGRNISLLKDIPNTWLGFSMATMAGATACSLFRTKFKLSPVFASGLVSIVAQALAPYHVYGRSAARMAWCGSFIAMCTPILTFAELIYASAVATFVTFFLQSAGWNAGGQLGAAALMGVIFTKKTISWTNINRDGKKPTQ